jgi:acyl carrier protein
MTGGSVSEQLIAYLKEKVLRGRGPEIGEDTALVSSGLIDSFALIEVLLQLEKLTNRRIQPGRVSPRDMDTVRLMLATAERVGKPRG